MNIKKLIIPIVLVLLFLIIVLWFLNWRNQEKLKELNEPLPKGVSVVKTLTGKYRVVNKIDGYEFKIPDEWEGVKTIEYVAEKTLLDYTASTIEIEGKRGGSRILMISRFKLSTPYSNLRKWAENIFDIFGLVGDFTEDKVGEYEIMKTQENVHLVGMYVYFFKKTDAVYSVTCGSEEFIKDIISNGTW